MNDWPPPRRTVPAGVGTGCAWLIIVCGAVVLVAVTVALVRWVL